MSGPNEVRDLTPEEVADGLSAGNVMLVDVREPNETQISAFPGRCCRRYRGLILTRCPIRRGGPSCFPVGQAFVRCVPRKPHWRPVCPMALIWWAV